MLTIQDMLYRHNHLAAAYKHAYERLKDQAHSLDHDVTVILKMVSDTSTDSRRYNLPTTNEVAAIIPESSLQSSSRDIILQLKSGPLHRVFETDKLYLPLQYVLLFPYGEPGWYINMPKTLTETSFIQQENLEAQIESEESNDKNISM